VIVDQVFSKVQTSGKRIQYTDYCDAFERVPITFGASFNSQQGGGKNKIPYEGDQSPLSFFVFSTPFSEDEVVEYLRLQKDESTREEGVNISFVNKLLESYDDKTSIKDGVDLWKRFEEVTGFVPLECWSIIEMSSGLTGEDQNLNNRLAAREGEITKRVIEASAKFLNQIQGFDGDIERFQGFLMSAARNKLHDVDDDSYCEEKENWHCWDLRFISCYLSSDGMSLSRPKALSTTISLAMMEVLRMLFDCNL